MPLDRLREVVGPDHVLTGAEVEERARDKTFIAGEPLAVVSPATTEEVAAVVRACADSSTAIVSRGAGTGLAGGAVPVAGGIVLSLERFDGLEIDAANLSATAGAGVITATLAGAAAEQGLFYPPDPASVAISTIGGNVACNAGGMRCLKYGVTADYVTGMTVVLADGTVLRLGGRVRKRASGYRLMQLFVGSEGTLGIVTEVTVKLIPLPRARATAMAGFGSVDAAAEGVQRLLASGHLPAGLELMDRECLALVADVLPAGFDPELEAILIVEQDGDRDEGVRAELAEAIEVLEPQVSRLAADDEEREALWQTRRQIGQVLARDPRGIFTEDIVVPIAQIPEMVRRVRALSESSGFRILLAGHAGDGNLHPVIVVGDRPRERVSAVAARIFRDAVELGGGISAEHGLGVLKRDFAELEHGAEALDVMRRLKRELDPAGLLNPAKVFPTGPADDEFLNRQAGWLDDAATPQPTPAGVERPTAGAGR